jgi:hypothetical protein
MRVHGKGLIGTAVVALVAGAPVLAQDGGGLLLTFGISERIEMSENAALAVPSSGRLTASTTSLSFGLSSETQTQVLRLGLSGALRLENGVVVDQFDNPGMTAFYSLTGANSALVLQAEAARSLLAQVEPSDEDPDPQGPGSRTSASASARLDLGTEGPLGLTLEASRSATDFSADAIGQSDSGTTAYAATAHLRFASGGAARLRAAQTVYQEQNIDDLQRETTDYALGWTQPLSSILTLDAEIGQQRVDTFELGGLVDRTEGVTGHVGLSLELASGTAGVSLAQSNEPGAVRQTLSAQRTFDLGNQLVALSLGATRLDDAEAALIGNLSWSYEAPAGGLSLDLGRSSDGGGLNSAVTNDHLSLGLSRNLSPSDRLGLSLRAARIDDSAAALIERMDLTASYSRDLGPDWLMTLGASMTRRDEAGVSAESSLLFLSLSRSFELRP